MQVQDSYPQDVYYDQPPQMYDNRMLPPYLPDPFMQSKAISQDQNFMKWLFNFRKEVIEPLKYVWRGYEYDHQKQVWIKNELAKPIMNEHGIGWCISLVESYINAVYVVSDYDDKHFNFDMREVVKVIYNNLSYRYEEYGMNKMDIMRVGGEIETKIKAVLLGAKNNGFRDFFTKQYQVHENINGGQMMGGPGQQKSSIIGSVLGLFNNRNNGNGRGGY